MGDAVEVTVPGDSDIKEEKPCPKIEQTEQEINRPKTNDDVQRAIDGLKDIPDEELQEFLDDEDFMAGLDVVDAWEGEEEKRPDVKPKSRSKSKEKERRRASR